MAGGEVASMGEGQTKGLIARETTGAPILLGAFFKGSEVIILIGMNYFDAFGYLHAKYEQLNRCGLFLSFVP